MRPAPWVVISSIKVAEGDAGRTPFTAQVTLNNWSGSLTVKIIATPGTASDADFIFDTVEVAFPTDGGSHTVSGFVVGDVEPEGDQYFTLTALSTSTVYPTYVQSVGGNIMITDDDQEGASRFHAAGASLVEGNQGTTVAEVRVALEPAAANTVTVVYETYDGSAKAGEDYRAVRGTLTFAPGEVLKTVAIDILSDAHYEPDEIFAVVLSQPNLALIGTPRAEMVIANDDAPVRATIADVTVDEGNAGVKSVPVVISFDGPFPPLAVVRVSLVGAGAVAGQDFRPLAQNVAPWSWATEATFTIDVLSDTVAECDEGFFIQYNTVSAGDDTVKVARVILRDDDGAVSACGDPFVPAAGNPVDGGGVPVAPIDAAPTDSMSARLDGGVVEPVPHPVDPAAGGTGDASVPREAASDTAAPQPPDQHLASRAGCACSVGGHGKGAWSFASALLVVLLALTRRRSHRSRNELQPR